MQIHAERDIVISVLSVGLSVCLSIAGTVDIIVTLFDVLVGESLVFQPDGRNKIPRGTLPQLGHRMYSRMEFFCKYRALSSKQYEIGP